MNSLKTKKRFIISLLIVFLFISNLNILTFHRTYAVSPGVVIVNTAKTIWEKIILALKESWTTTKSFAFKRAYQMFMEKLAYNAATFLVEAAPGKHSTWNLKNWKHYLKDAGDAATAEFLDSAMTSLSSWASSTTGGKFNGFDICSPPGGINVALKVAIPISKGEIKKPRCSLDSIKKKWGDLGDKLNKDPFSLAKFNGQSLKEIGTIFGYNKSDKDLENKIRVKLLQSTISLKESDLGFEQYMLAAVDENKSQELENKIKDRENSDNAKPVRKVITGDISVPGSISEEKLKQLEKVNQKAAEKRSDSLTADTVSIFLNTLLQKGMQKLIKEMFIVDPPQTKHKSKDYSNYYEQYDDIKQENIVKKTFESFNKIKYNFNSKNVDIITEMETDLGSEFTGKLNNKTIDSNFAEVLRRAQGGQSMTLREAMKENLIDGNKWFGYINVNDPDNISQPDISEGFSLNNIKKLVKNRVVPVGWIFAAEKIKDMQGQESGCKESYGCSLNEVIEQYSQSGTYTIGGNENKFKNKYCGWRPISADPYFIDINEKDHCNANYLDSEFSLRGLKTEWIGGTQDGLNINGICYKYQDTSDPLDGIIDVVEQVDINEEGCNAFEASANQYYEWHPGGCMVIEEDEAPLCHLVDPDTVLKAPLQQCNAEGYYSVLESKESPNRQKDCANVKHCIQEDDQGNCVGDHYDYCTKEKNIWRFNGDSCQKQFSSCATLIDNEKNKQSYLLNTLKACPQMEVGCRDYVVQKKFDSESDEFIWDNDAQRIYFNNTISECSDSGQGCHEFIEVKPGVNLVPNSSFEIDEGPQNELPDAWVFETDSLWQLNDIEFVDGLKSLKCNDFDSEGSNFSIKFELPNKGIYTLSYYVRASALTRINPKLIINYSDDSVETYTNEDANFSVDSANNKWERVSGYFSLANNKDINYVQLKFDTVGTFYLDAIKFELNNYSDENVNSGFGAPSAYSVYGANAKNYFKKAPDYLNCEDYDLNSYDCNQNYNPCCDYLKYCPAHDLNCQAYQPLNGDHLVPAVIKDEDKCVAECNNYQTFVAQASYFDNLESVEENGEEAKSQDVNFIADTAQDCSEPSCELFTNLDELEKGAESKEYYSFVRQCVKPSDSGVSIKLYYTWEGSDTSAFQLKTWKLLSSGVEDSLNHGQGGYAPCVNVEIGKTTCSDLADASNIMECDPKINFDCRTFYDENAVAHNRLLSKTIPITDECLNLRRELSNKVYKVAPSMSKKCSVKNVGCLTYQGNNSANVRNIFDEDFETGSVLGWMADIDGGGNAINLTPSSEAISYDGSSMKVYVSDLDNTANAIWLSYNLTKAGVNIIPNKQYLLSFWAKAFGDNTSGSHPAPKYNSNNPGDTALFNNIFRKKVQAQESPDVLLSFDNNLSVIDSEWSLYKYDINDFHFNVDGDVILTFKIKINNTVYHNDGFYIDNIILKGITNSFNKIKNSWQTPRVCLDNNYLGCQEYQDINQNTFYIYQFSDLCPEENVGCTAMIDTQNSSMPFQQTFNAYCQNDNEGTECSLGKYYYKNNQDILENNFVQDTVIIPEDKLVYVVKNDTYSCLSDDKGCQEMSLIDNNGENKNVYFVNNPDNYISDDFYGGTQSILCLDEYKNCVSFKKKDGSIFSAIHPRNLTCEYKNSNAENQIPGFYTKDGHNCTTLLYNRDYDDFTSSLAENWKPYDSYENKYAALCPAEENKCNEFIDPLDNLDLRDYYYANLKINLNYNNPSEWKEAKWLKQTGEISDFNSNGDDNGISYHPEGDDGYDGLNVIIKDDRNLLIYRGPDYTKDIFDFNVESGTTYRLSARVKFPDTGHSVQSIMTFLVCKQDIDSDTYFVSEEWNDNDNNTPYAFPNAQANYFVNNDSNQWQYIYGLYNILPGAHYCNLAFYIHGDNDSKIILSDINLEKVNGDYYYLDNNSLDRESCSKANLKEGCVLFHNTLKNLKWNVKMSYQNNNLSPGDEKNPSDVNELLKVKHDKQCAEWLSCGAYLKTMVDGQEKNNCISLIACDELAPDGSCAHPFLHNKDAQALTLDYYQKIRAKAGWSDYDYDGYSIPGLYPLDSLNSFEIVNGNTTTTVLGHIVVKQNADNQAFVYKFGPGVKNYTSNSEDDNLIGESNDNVIQKSCRLYPEKDSPFPWQAETNIAQGNLINQEGNANYMNIVSKSSNFNLANICQAGSGSDLDSDNDCECNYIKADYGSQKLYFPYIYTNEQIPETIQSDYDSNQNLKLKSKNKYLGWKGFCLDSEKSLIINNTGSLVDNEKDYRCLSWYPLDLISGETDSFSMSEGADIAQTAGVSSDSKLCLISENYQTEEDRFYCAYFDNYNGVYYCNVIVRIPAGTKVNTNNLNDTESKLLFFGTEQGDTWLTADVDGGNGHIFYEVQADDIKKNGGSKSIVYKSTNPAVGNNKTGEDFPVDTNNNKYTLNDFHISQIPNAWVGDTDHILNKLADIFDSQNTQVEKYYYDERVDINGETRIGHLESDNSIILFDGSTKTTGAECHDCTQAKKEAALCDSNHHQVRLDCDRSRTNCGLHKWRDAERNCNPRPYNYYVNYDSSVLSNTILIGRCAYNCQFTDSNDEEKNHGRSCLQNAVGGFDRYQTVKNIYDNVSGDLESCKENLENNGSALNDCKYVKCIEESNINDENLEYSCSDYRDDDKTCDQYLFDENRILIASIDMLKSYYKCFVGGEQEINGNIIDFSEGPNPYYDNSENCEINPYSFNSNANCSGCNNNGICDDACGCNFCLDIVYPYVDDNNYDYDNLEMPNNCSNNCLQVCKTYVNLDGAIYNSNNFYLNWLEPGKIFSSPSPDQVCNVNNQNICPSVLSGHINNYSQDAKIRFNEIASSTNINVFDQLSDSNNPSVFSANPNGNLRKFIYTDSRPGAVGYFNDFYANFNQGENLNSAKQRLNKILVKVEDNKFQEYSSNTWSSPNSWVSPYWDLTNSYNSSPFIKTVEYNSTNSEFNNGVFGISINNVHGQHIISSHGSLNAYLKFYASAGEGATPIQKIIVNWTGLDYDSLELKGPFKNHKHDCVRKCGNYYKDINWNGNDNIDCVDDSDCSEDGGGQYCFAQTWGDHQNACIEDNVNDDKNGFFSYRYIYTCNALSDYWHQNCSDYDSNIHGACCIYTPKVTIIDNWGKEATEDLGDCANNKKCSIIVIPR